MSAKDQIAQMLNELMGPSRNEDVNRSMLNYKDEDVCKFFLVGFCPHDEFVNTKADMGPCQFIHDENLRIAYRNSEHFEKLGYERQFYRFLCRIYDDVQRKIDRNKERLELTQGQNIDEGTRTELTERSKQLEKDMTEYMQMAEDAGEKGQLERSQKYVKKAEELKIELDSVRQTLTNPSPHVPRVVNDPNAPKPMRVCEVCGCFLIIGDVQQRIEDHLNGKQHLGYAKIAMTIDELKGKFRDDYSPSPDRHRSSRRSSERDRKSESSRSHHDDDRRSKRSKRSRSRSRDRHRRHSRSRSRSGDRKSSKSSRRDRR